MSESNQTRGEGQSSSRRNLWLLPLTALLTILISAGAIFGAIMLWELGVFASDPAEERMATPTPFFTPKLRLSPKIGLPGSSIEVTGQDWPPNDAIFIGLEDPADSEVQPLALENVTTDDDGHFSAVVEYPVEPYWTDLSIALITAEAQSTGVRTAESFHITNGATE